MLQGLADKMTAQTQVHVEVRDAVRLDDPQLLQVPFVLMTVDTPFEFTDSEAANLGAYLTGGGFLFADISRVLLRPDYSDDELDIPAMRSLIRASFQAVGYQEWKDWKFKRLEITHPLYHCFYDVNSLPRGMRDIHFLVGEYPPRTPDYLEGIVVGEQLVGVYSMRGYADFWAGIGRENLDWSLANNAINHSSLFSAEEPLVYNLGVNLVVYALTREIGPAISRCGLKRGGHQRDTLLLGISVFSRRHDDAIRSTNGRVCLKRSFVPRAGWRGPAVARVR